MIIGYRETIEVFENIMIMSATGTATKIKQKSSMNINQIANDRLEASKIGNRFNSTNINQI